MPLKLPKPFKHILPSKRKSSSKQASKHGGPKNDALDNDNTAATPLAMASWPGDKCDGRASPEELRQLRELRLQDQHTPRPGTLGTDAELSFGAWGERVETDSPEVCRQESITSDYRTLTPASSVVSQISSQAGSASDREGLPELLRPEDNFHSVDPFTDSGVQQTLVASSGKAPPPRTRGKKRGGETWPPPRADPQQCQNSTQSERLVPGGEAGPRQPTSLLQDQASRGRNTPPTNLSSSSPTVPLRPKRSADDDKASPKSSVSAPVPRSREGSGADRVVSSAPAPVAAEEELGALESDVFPQVVLQTPIGALRKSRKRLCLMLNIEQPQIETEWTPDYMGLAELLGFDTVEIQNFWERNPADSLFLEWSRSHSKGSRLLPPVLSTLLQCLDKLGRQDIVMECRGLILEDVSDYLAEQRLLESYNVGRLQKFDCYVNIAEQDLLGVGRDILQNLEGVHGLRLCLTLRDVTLGGFEYEEMAKMLETRCDSKVLIVLTKSYEDSDACQFLTQFAVTLDPGSRKNKLIPLIVDEDTFVPRVLRCLAMLNYHRDKRLGFLWPRLKHAIKAPPQK